MYFPIARGPAVANLTTGLSAEDVQASSPIHEEVRIASTSRRPQLPRRCGSERGISRRSGKTVTIVQIVCHSRSAMPSTDCRMIGEEGGSEQKSHYGRLGIVK